jgi:hypothetical protein
MGGGERERERERETCELDGQAKGLQVAYSAVDA